MTFVAASSNTAGTASNMFPTAVIPAGAAAGQLGLAIITQSSNLALSNIPASWTLLISQRRASSGQTVNVYAFTVTSGGDSDPGATISPQFAGGQRWTMGFVIYSGMRPVADIATPTQVNASQDSTTVVASPITPDADNATIVNILGLNCPTSGTTYTLTIGGAYNERIDVCTTAGAAVNQGLHVSDAVLTGGGGSPTTPDSATATASVSRVAISVALLPLVAAAAGSATPRSPSRRRSRSRH